MALTQRYSLRSVVNCGGEQLRHHLDNADDRKDCSNFWYTVYVICAVDKMFDP